MKVSHPAIRVISTALAVALLVAAFEFAQALVIPKFKTDGTAITTAYRYLDKDSVDVLFVGSSQMFCTVDAGRLTDEYSISSFDYGASGQEFVTAKYYFDTAVRTQRPKVVMMEMCSALVEHGYNGADALAWNYSAMPASVEKFRSVYEVLEGDVVRSLVYTYAPIFEYHDRWKSLSDEDLLYAVDPTSFSAETLARRGFLPRDHVESGLSLAYLGEEDGRLAVPDCNASTVAYIAGRCKEIGARLVLFKSPACDWTKAKSRAVDALADSLGIDFVDMNAWSAEMGIDVTTDFYNARHLNTRGAEKATEWLYPYLKKAIES